MRRYSVKTLTFWAYWSLFDRNYSSYFNFFDFINFNLGRRLETLELDNRVN